MGCFACVTPRVYYVTSSVFIRMKNGSEQKLEIKVIYARYALQANQKLCSVPSSLSKTVCEGRGIVACPTLF
jgi:hypothetical protein